MMLEKMILQEANKNQLLQRAKNADSYKDTSKGKNRYDRRTKSKISNSVKEYNKIDMKKFFKDDVLDLTLAVHGETDDYFVSISMDGVLKIIREDLKRSGQELTYAVVLRSIIKAYNLAKNVYVRCTCLHPETKIKLLDGTCPTVQEMCDRFNSGEQLYVYSVDENGDFKPGVVENVWKTSEETNFIKVTLDNGKYLITTPNHLYMMRTGSYAKAEDLKVGDSLMPMYFSATNGYETVKLNSEVSGWRSVYKLVAEYFKQDEITQAEDRAKDDSSMSYKVAIHHINFNKLNNNPDNLKLMTAREHWNYHSSLGFNSFSPEVKEKIKQLSRERAFTRNANPTPAMIQQRQEFTRKGVLRNYDEDRKVQQAQIMRNISLHYWQNLTDEEYADKCARTGITTKASWDKGCFDTEKFHAAALQRGVALHSPDVEKKTGEGIRRYWENISEEDLEKKRATIKSAQKKSIEKIKGVPFSEEHKKKLSESRLSKSPEQRAMIADQMQRTKIKYILQQLIDNHLELNNDNYEAIRSQLRGYPRISNYYTSIDEAVSEMQLNHKIIDIEYITLENTPVYDIKVKDFHNFVTEAGVVLHNCDDWRYRLSYYASLNNIIVGDKETRPSKITNPNDSLGPACKHVLLVLSNSSWCTKLASTVWNYINYVKKHYEDAYAKNIYPKLYGKEYEDDTQLGLFDDEAMNSDEETIDKSNEEGRTRGQFKPGNTSGIRFMKKNSSDEVPGQETLDLENNNEKDVQ